MQPELYKIWALFCQVYMLTAFIFHSNNWIVYAWSMKAFRADMKMIIHNAIKSLKLSK